MSVSTRLPPPPKSQGELYRWATEITRYLDVNLRVSNPVTPEPILLPHRVEPYDERATTDGLMLYDPDLNQIVYSEGGSWIPLLGVGNVAISQFGEQLIVERTPLIELQSRHGLSILRDITYEPNSASVQRIAGEFELSTGTTVSTIALLESAERGRYIPGFAAEIGIGARFPTAPTGNQVFKWGGWDDESEQASDSSANGFYWGYDATGIFVAYVDGGTETKYYQGDWTIDNLDGNGKSGITLDMTAGNIFQVEFTWYGYGEIVFQIVQDPPPPKARQRPYPVHAIRIEGSTSIEDPNLYLFAVADNGGDAADATMYVGGRSYTILGRYVPAKRITGQEVVAVSTSPTLTPHISFRRKADFLDRSIRVQGFEGIVATEDVIVKLILDGTLTGATFGNNPTNHVASETALEYDVDATAISGGHCLYSQLFQAGTGVNRILNTAAAALSDIEIPRRQPITLCTEVLDGAGSGTATFNLKLNEEW